MIASRHTRRKMVKAGVADLQRDLKRAALAELLCELRPEPELHRHRIMPGTLMVSRGGMERREIL